MTNELTALLFDVDGTLADTEELHRLAFNSAFARAGLDWEWSESLYGDLLAVTGGRERIRHYVERYRPSFVYSGDLDVFIADLHQAKTREYTRMIADRLLPLRTGVLRLMQEARTEGLRLCIATTTSMENVMALLEHSVDASAPSWFDVIAAGNMVSHKKPAPDIFNYALQKLGLPASRCMAVEDSHNGLCSALAAGVRTLVTVNSFTRGHQFDGAALVVNHLGEPDHPFTVLAGDAYGASYVNVPLLRRIHAQAPLRKDANH